MNFQTVLRKHLRFLLLGGLAAGTALTVKLQQAAPAKEDFEVPMRLAGSMPAVEVMVNGKGPFVFGIDTGAQGMARVDSALVEKLGLKTSGSVQGTDPSGRGPRAMATVRVESLEIGGLRFSDIEAATRDYNLSPRMPKIDGILTLNLLSEYLVTLDFRGKVVRAAKGELPKAPDVQTYRSEGGIPMVELTVGTATLDARIDTGNGIGAFVLPTSLAEKLSFIGEQTTVGRARSVSGEMEIKSGQVRETIRFAGEEFLEPSVTYPALGEAANIGSKALADFTVTFDPRNSRLRLTGDAAERSK